MITEPVGAQAVKQLTGGFSSDAGEVGGGARTSEAFRAAYRIERTGQ